MSSPCENLEWPQCVRDQWVEITLSDFPPGFTDGPATPPDGRTPLQRALIDAYGAHPSVLKVAMPGGWEEEIAAGAMAVMPYPGADLVNPQTRYVVQVEVAGLGVGLNYPRPPGELAALWAGSLTMVALPGGGTCRVAVVGPYTSE